MDFRTSEMNVVRTILLILVVAVAACAPATVRDGATPGPVPEIAWPARPETPRIRLLYSFSEPGDIGIKPGAFKRFVEFFAGKESQAMLRPYAVTADDEMIAVADPGLRLIHLFLIKESKYEVIRTAGDENFESPVGISLSQDAIYVADSAAGKVFVFDREGEHSHTINSLTRPTGITFHAASGRLFITDTIENEVVVLDESGTRLDEFGTRGLAAGDFNFPTSLALHGDTLFVNDTLNFRVQAFALDGTHISSFGEIGDGSGQFALSKGLGTDAEGHIYVADALSNYVQIFDKDGQFLLSFGGMGGEAGKFRLPTGLYIFNNTIYIADSQNQRVQVFEFLGGET
jgi:DNA-binding beta-propeller fold protein YncE